MSKNPIRFMVELERSPQGDVIKRFAPPEAESDTDAVRMVLDAFFAQNKTQKVRLKRCYQIII